MYRFGVKVYGNQPNYLISIEILFSYTEDMIVKALFTLNRGHGMKRLTVTEVSEKCSRM